MLSRSPDAGVRSGAPSADRSPEQGAVTAELAVASTAVALALLLVLAVAAVGAAQVRAQLAAGAAARASARGDSPATVSALVRTLAGDGASVTRSGDHGGLVTVSVQRPFTLPLPGAPSLPLRARGAALAPPPPDQP